MARRHPVATMHPLIVPVVVHANQVEHLGASAQLGIARSPQHIPCLVLRGSMAARVFHDGGILLDLLPVGRDMNDGLGLDKSCSRIDPPNRIDRGQRGPYQLPLQLRPAALLVRPEGLHIAADRQARSSSR